MGFLRRVYTNENRDFTALAGAGGVVGAKAVRCHVAQGAGPGSATTRTWSRSVCVTNRTEADNHARLQRPLFGMTSYGASELAG